MIFCLEVFTLFLLGFAGGPEVKNLPAVQETWVRSLDQADILEKGMAPHSSIRPWRMSWTEEPGGYSPWGHKELDTAESPARSLFTPL